MQKTNTKINKKQIFMAEIIGGQPTLAKNNLQKGLELQDLAKIKSEIIKLVSELTEDFDINEFDNNLVDILEQFKLTSTELKSLLIFAFGRIQTKFCGEDCIAIRKKLAENLTALYGSYLKNIVLVEFPVFAIPKSDQEIVCETELIEITNQIIKECVEGKNNLNEIFESIKTKLPDILQGKSLNQQILEKIIENLIQKITPKFGKDSLKSGLIDVFSETLIALEKNSKNKYFDIVK